MLASNVSLRNVNILAGFGFGSGSGSMFVGLPALDPYFFRNTDLDPDLSVQYCLIFLKLNPFFFLEQKTKQKEFFPDKDG